MVEGDNSSGGTDKDEDIYCTIITGLIMFVLPLMVFTFLQAALSNHPLFSQLFVCSVSLFQASCPLTPLLLNMLPTAASVWKLSCSLTGSSTLVIRVMTADEQYICCSEMVPTPRPLWGLTARLRPPRNRAAQSVTSLTLTFVYRWQVVVVYFLCGFCVEGENLWVTKKKKKILLDNCLTGKWSARICSETSTRRCINHCTSQYVLNQQVCLPWKKTPLQSLHFYFYFFTVYTVIFKSYKYGQPLYWAWSVTINLLL